MRQAIFTAQASTLADYQFLELTGYGAHYSGGTQTAVLFAELAGAAEDDAATLRAALIYNKAVIGFVTVTITATAIDGAYGKVCTVSCDTTQQRAFDVLGFSSRVNKQNYMTEDRAHWRIGLVSVLPGSATGLRVCWDDSPGI